MIKKSIYFLFFILLVQTACAQQEKYPFENEVTAFVKQDEKNSPQKQGFLFIGSSSIRMWADLETRFDRQPIVKRGVGGCTLNQLVNYYTNKILFPYQPRKVFVYAGENDIVDGADAQNVHKNFVRLCDTIKSQLPKTTIYFMAIKRGPAREKFAAEFVKANQLIKSYAAKTRKVKFIDTASPILNQEGKPDSTLFKEDGIHLKLNGYDLWEKTLKKHVL